MVAIVLDCRNLFEILRSIDNVESYVYGCLLLGSENA